MAIFGGTYNEDLTVNNAIRLVEVSGQEVTITGSITWTGVVDAPPFDGFLASSAGKGITVTNTTGLIFRSLDARPGISSIGATTRRQLQRFGGRLNAGACGGVQGRSECSAFCSMARFIRFFFTTGLMWSSLGLHLVICACYLRRWDKAAAITVFPFWAWALAGLFMAGIAWIIARKRLAALLTGLWLITLVAGSDETRPLLRFTKETPQRGKPVPAASGAMPLRIITLNCRAGMWNQKVLEELIPWNPDIVFLQERPFPADLLKAAVKIFPGTPGYFEAGSNCAILSRTKILTPLYGHQPYSMLGAVELRPGQLIELACVHLQGAETSMKLWSRDAWRSHYYNRQSRRSQLSLFMGAQQLFSGNNPVIIGGDFNAPAGDGVFDLLKLKGYTDAFAAAGSGWPCTYPNAAPVLRIDHIWMRGLTPLRATTVRTERSDHRMVVCDFLLP